ncbi:MAG TPA: lamin tail domain-containing protein, partial [Polyangia bacterium]|nr:lamin tail domain-containing protein [Polyangia bacterium]
GTAAYPANLTPDGETGIGDWSDDEIVRALRAGVDDQGAPLCPPMPRFASMTDSEASAIVAYLRSLVPVANAVPPSSCPPLKGDDSEADGSDGGAAIDLASPADLAAPDDLADGCAPLINEVQTAGANGASDEFVELYNPCAAAIDLGGWRLVHRSAAGAVDVTLLDLAGPIAPGGFVVCAGKAFAGKADLRYGGGLAATGGGLALRDAGGAARDSLGWGNASNPLVRGAAAAAPPSGKSLARHPDGRNSDDNAADFSVGAPTPGAGNS